MFVTGHASFFVERLQLSSLGPCLRRSHQPSLAACSWVHQVKSCRPGVQGPPRLCTVVLWTFTYVADLPSRRGLRSSCSDCLVQPPVHRSTVGSRAFSVAGPWVWNCLPPEVTSAPSLTTFRTRLKDVSVRFCFLTFDSSDIFVYTLSIVDLAVF